MPISQDLSATPNARLKIRALKNGIVMTEGTINGAPPIANAGGARTLECSAPRSAVATLDGSLSVDPDGDKISFYTWSAPGATFVDATVAQPTGTFPLGSTTVSLVVNDGVLSSGTATATITVRDTTPPCRPARM